MEPNQSFGSFGNVSSDNMSAIKEALARRQSGQGGTPALNQQSASSPTASPQPAQPSGSMPQPTGELPQTPNLTQQGNPEAKMIVGALRERLKAISTTELGPMAK